MEKCKDILKTWLNNAYAMEKSLTMTLKAHAEDAEEWGLQDLASKLHEHIQETEEQAEKVKGMIESMGGDTSTLKTESAELMGIVQGVMNEVSGDKVVKNTIAEHAAEHFEMASYMAIAHLAEKCGEEEVASQIQEILKQEEEGGEMTEDKISTVVDRFVERETEEKEEE